MFETQSSQREQGSENIFADLNIPEPSLYLAKAQLAHQICTIIQQRNLTQVEAAKILGINQPKVSALTKGNLDGFSSDRLFKFLNLLDHDIEITIHPTINPSQKARIRVNGA
ncbi:MAG: helix-turn-helix domain-containing protein [Waterburya sp.]